MPTVNFNPENLICSECGRVINFGILSPDKDWKYKIHTIGRRRIDTDKPFMQYQCSYTCYDHACLRSKKEAKHLTQANRKKYVDSCENSMRSQGKAILHPIEV